MRIFSVGPKGTEFLKDPSETNPGDMEGWAEKAADQLDAGFFTGDTFQNEGALARIEWYLSRWQREAARIRETLKAEVSPADGAPSA